MKFENLAALRSPGIPLGVALRRILLRAGIVFTGPYESWDSARHASSGYESSTILDTVKRAALKVKRGEAAFERDGVAFPEPSHSPALLSSILLAAFGKPERLVVMDLGGALGSVFQQHRQILAEIPGLRIRWCVVEQPAFAQCGRELFQDDELVFYDRIEDCQRSERPNLVVLSAFLQYVPNPFELMAAACCGASHVFIDYAPLRPGTDDVIMVQHVPPSIYLANYPSWIFSKAKFMARLRPTWRVLSRFDTMQIKSLRGLGASYEGFLLARGDNAP